MTPTPTGRLMTTPTGPDLILSRTFRAPIDDVWASLTEPDRTARWFGSWEGEPGTGRTVQVRMVFEGDSAEPAPVEIVACEPPSHLHVTMTDGTGVWRLEARLAESDGITTLDFIQHFVDTAGIHEIGPGWEYYLDKLVAERRGDAHPEWDDSYTAMQAYYQNLATAGDPTIGVSS